MVLDGFMSLKGTCPCTDLGSVMETFSNYVRLLDLPLCSFLAGTDGPNRDGGRRRPRNPFSELDSNDPESLEKTFKFYNLTTEEYGEPRNS